MDGIFGELCSSGWAIIFFLLFIFGMFVFLTGIRIVRPLEKGVIERLGKFKRVADQGFTWIIPVFDKMYKINLTERMMDVLPQEVITEVYNLLKKKGYI